MAELLAQLYKMYASGHLHKTLQNWLNPTLSDSSEDDESNTSPPVSRVHRTSYIVHRTSYIVHCASYIVHRTSYISYIVHRTLYISVRLSTSYISVNLTLYIVHRTSYIVHRTFQYIVPELFLGLSWTPEGAHSVAILVLRGAPKGRARGARPPPLGREKHYIFRVSSVKLRDSHL